MDVRHAEQMFRRLEGARHAFHSRDIAILLGEQGEKLRSTIRRLLAADVIERVARDLYWHAPSAPLPYAPAEEIAAALRPSDLCYVGMESAAARWGVISQIPVDRLTVVTTGREGTFPTRFGTIEFIHTKADASEIMSNTVPMEPSPLRIASKRYTVLGLKRARRSLDLIDDEEVNDGEA